jgi:hypothetical protein
MSLYALILAVLALGARPDAGDATHILSEESAAEIQGAFERTRATLAPALTLSGEQIKVLPERAVLQFRIDGALWWVTLIHPGPQALADGWRHFAPSDAESLRSPDHGPLLRVLRTFDGALTQDPWRTPSPTALVTPPSTPLAGDTEASSGPLFAALVTNILVHWLIMLAPVLFLVRRSLRGRGSGAV